MGEHARTRSTRFLWRLRPYFRQVGGLLIVGSIGGVIMNTAVVLPAVLLGRAIDTALRADQHRASAADVGWAALLFVAGTAATELPRIGKRWWLGMARHRFRANVRADALRGVLAWPMDRLAVTPVGEVMSRVIGDAEVLATGVGEVMVETWDTLLFSLSLILTMLLYDPTLAAAALVPVPLALALAKASGRLVARRTTVARQRAADLTTALREQLGAVRVLRLFGRSGAATERIAVLAGAQAHAEIAAIGLDEALTAVYTALLGVGVVAVVWLGGERVVAGSMSVGGLVAFLALFGRFITRAPRIPLMANRVQAAGAAFARLEPLLAPALPVTEEPSWSSLRATYVAGSSRAPVAPRPRRAAAPAVWIDGVTFSYPGSGAPALLDIHLEAEAGSFVAVTGPVGSGKSALARVLAGLYRPTAGRILVDGTPVTELADDERATRIGYLAQEAHLFSGTVVDNIKLEAARSDGGEDRAVRQAATVAALGPDLAAMPAGLDTEIGELGVRVSGGQRSRIALARTLAAAGHVPGLLVLDDPFSAVDVDTEAAIIAGLRSAVGPGAAQAERATIVLCSHRLAAFPLADLVVVLDHGRISEMGSHTELLASGGLYARIYRAQAVLTPGIPVAGCRDGRR